MPDPIPMLDLGPELAAVGDELEAAAASVIRSGRFILGPNVEAFEREVADYLGVRFAIGLNSGTDALWIGLSALGIGRGDEVITPAYTYFATAESISLLGAKPVFCDIRPDVYTLDPEQVEACITPRTKAIVPVHLFGHAADMDPIRAIAERHGLRLLEDAAQAFGGRYRGQRVGSLADAAAFSFFPSKNLGALGDGGLLATDDEGVAETARLWRTHGSHQRDVHDRIAYNSRLDEIQAAMLRVKLPHVDEWNEGRQRVAALYDAGLAELPGVSTPPCDTDVHHIFHQYTLRVRDGRDELQAALAADQITSAVYYSTPVHRLEVYAADAPKLPVAERAALENLSLPIGPLLDGDTVARVVGAVQSWASG